MSIKICLGVTLWVACFCVFASAKHDWDQYKNNFNKTYHNPKEEAYRKDLFLKKAAEIDLHNADGSKTYKKGINQFTDMTKEEFKVQFTGAKAPSGPIEGSRLFSSARATAPAAIDWRTKNVVTAVKDQGQCGSCWAFSTTGALESAYAIKHGSLISLSEEYLVDCDYNEYGCGGGWPDEAMNYIQSNGGIPTESAYPYTAGTYGVEGACRNTAKSGVSVTSTSNNGGSESTLKQMVGTVGPVSVAVDAGDGCDWSSYSSGIFNEPGCFYQTDHAVLAVGYDTNAGYWLIKNSWGTWWGENGYIRLAYGSDMCGVADYGYIPASN